MKEVLERKFYGIRSVEDYGWDEQTTSL